MKNRIALASLFLITALTLTLPLSGLAAGLPNSTDFELGGRLDLWGTEVSQALSAASVLGMQWIAVDFNWARQWPDLSTGPDLTQLDQTMNEARQANLRVMITLTQPPDWALTPSGPNAGIVAEIVYQLLIRYPSTFAALELFPAANTLHGWGVQPDAQAYADLLTTTQVRLDSAGLKLTIIAGGFLPLDPQHAQGDLDDLAFIKELNATGIDLPFIGLRFESIQGQPLDAPQANDHRYLRHFEEVRSLLNNSGHGASLIWITGFSWPAANGQEDRQALTKAQADWLGQSLLLLRGRTYIGAAFFSSLNPSDGNSNQAHTLVEPDASLHPACDIVNKFIVESNKLHTTNFHGSVSKRNPARLELKPEKP